MNQPPTSPQPDSGEAYAPAPDDGIGGDGAVLLDGSDLPAFCPNPRMPLWNTHPRVYLEAAVTGTARCPYCGTLYRLRPGAAAHGH